MDRFAQISAGSYPLSVSTLGEDAAPATVTSPAVVITDGSGLQVDSGTPVYANGALAYAATASKYTLLDTYHCVWTGNLGGVAQSWTSDFELCGAYLCQIAQIRAFDRVFADPVKYPLATLRAVRKQVEDFIERAALVAFTSRGRRALLSGSAPDFYRGYSPLTYGNETRKLLLPDVAVQFLYSGSIFGVAFTSDDLANIVVDDNLLYRSSMYPSWPFGRENIALHYVHGLTLTPEPINRAALILMREYLINSELPGRATATSIGDQMFRLTVAGRDGATGLPEVDSAIAQFGRQKHVVG